jgi:hypothetical protein
MINKLIILPLIFTTLSYASHEPSPLSEGPNPRGIFNFFYSQKKINYLAEFEFREEEDNRNYKAFRIGGKYRFHRNFKAGLYAKRAYGLRHDDDWVKPNNDWIWNDSESRGENLIILELTSRALLNFIPGGTWLGEFRIQNETNFFNDQNSFKLRSGITYIWTRNAKTFISLYTQYEVYLPTNFSNESIYEKWLYLGGLYHFNKNWKFGLFYSKKSVTWTTSQTSKDLGNEDYSIEDKVNYLGIKVNYYWD